MSSLKPQWLFPDSQLSSDAGVSFTLRYIGAMPVRVSTKSVDLTTRTKIAYASIQRVCEDVGLKLPRPQSIDKSIQSFIGPTTNMTWSMTNVQLKITSQTLTVETLKENVTMFQHNLFLVSFASAGDAETMDFICYIAKTVQNTRMCYVFECPVGLAQDVIITVGQAFGLGYKDFKELPTSKSNKLTKQTKLMELRSDGQSGSNIHQGLANINSGDQSGFGLFTRTHPDEILPNLKSELNTSSIAFDNFVDFDENTWLLSGDANNHGIGPTSSSLLTRFNSSSSPAQNTDLGLVDATFHAPIVDPVQNSPTELGSNIFERLEPVGEPWYVGPMSRIQAESLLRYDGDFLVRASVQQPGQFVLSGLQDGKCKHLLLADPNGKVRTKECVFDSIQHLVDYHVQNGAPIRSADSEIKLIFPVSTHVFCIS